MSTTASTTPTLTSLPPELIHLIALTALLSFRDVTALALTCRRMASVLHHDPYGRDLRYALRGVFRNLYDKRWVSAQYAVCRRWFDRSVYVEMEEYIGERVAEFAVSHRGDDNIRSQYLKTPSDVAGFEDVLLTALSLPSACVELMSWDYENYDSGRPFVELTSLLHVAAVLGSQKLLTFVLERGGELETVDTFSCTPLRVAFIAGNLGIAKKLIEAGADVKARNFYDRNMLFAASMSGSVEVMRFVLELGVFDVDEKDNWGMTPLMYACDFGHLDVIKVLVEEGGADVNVVGEERYEGEAALHRACWCNDDHTELVQYLVDAGAGAGVGEGHDMWMQAFAIAIERRNIRVVDLLIGMGVVG